MKKIITNYWWIGVILIVIPPVLNYVLQMSLPGDFPIIENASCGGAPATWLVFWGSYLAACASFTMAMISYLQNKKIREQNAARIEYELALKQYEELEKFVLEADRIFSINAFDILCRCASKKGTDSPEFLKAFYEYDNALMRSRKTSLKLLNFSSEAQKEYSAILKLLYSQSGKLLGILATLQDSQSKDTDFNKFRQTYPAENGGKSDYDIFLEFAQQRFEQCGIGDFYNKGFKFLEIEWKNVQTKLNNTK